MYRAKRNGFTLVEMLVVLTIVVVLSVIIVPFISKTNDRDIVNRGARLLQGALIQARARAQAENVSNGVRLLPTTVVSSGNTTLAWSEQLEYVHDPGDFIDGFATGPLPIAGVATPYSDPLPPPYSAPGFPYSVVAVSKVPPPGTPGPQGLLNNNPGNSAVGDPVRPGDFIEFDGNGQVFMIMGFPGQSTGIPAYGNNAAVPGPLPLVPNFPYGTTLVVSRLMTNTPVSPPLSQTNYRIMRKARPIPGEKPLEMPRGVVVDLTWRFNLTQNPPNGNLSGNDRDQGNAIWMRGLSTTFNLNNTVDIMFGPGGNVVGDAAVNDIIYFWLHPSGEPNNWLLRNPGASLGEAGNQSLVVVYSRNGATHSNPVDQGIPGGPLADPYSYAKTARAQNVGGL